jgi:hypothetical protein
MVTGILKTTEIDIIWGFIYAGMVVSVLTILIIMYGIIKGDR